MVIEKSKKKTQHWRYVVEFSVCEFIFFLHFLQENNWFFENKKKSLSITLKLVHGFFSLFTDFIQLLMHECNLIQQRKQHGYII
jgi:hypothetical protein